MTAAASAAAAVAAAVAAHITRAKKKPLPFLITPLLPFSVNVAQMCVLLKEIYA